jgi:hypothetical protein
MPHDVLTRCSARRSRLPDKLPGRGRPRRPATVGPEPPLRPHHQLEGQCRCGRSTEGRLRPWPRLVGADHCEGIGYLLIAWQRAAIRPSSPTPAATSGAVALVPVLAVSDAPVTTPADWGPLTEPLTLSSHSSGSSSHSSTSSYSPATIAVCANAGGKLQRRDPSSVCSSCRCNPSVALPRDRTNVACSRKRTIRWCGLALSGEPACDQALGLGLVASSSVARRRSALATRER